jgi:hypothetical protein
MLDLSRPIVVYKGFWPASVLLPDRKVWHRCRAYITDQGLAIFQRPAEVPAFFSPLDWVSTPEPHVQRQVGIDVHTTAGLVVITLVGGCGCGNPLKRWRPRWAGTVAAWPVRT